MPSGPIEVKTGSAYWSRLGCIALLFGGLTITMVLMGVKGLGSQYGTGTAPWLILFGLALPVVPLVVMVRSRRTWAARLDARGVTIRSGRLLPWPELRSVVVVHTRYGQVNHYEIVFAGGRARVFPRVLGNAAEVMPALASLREGRNPFTS
jgi:hypothetical protein